MALVGSAGNRGRGGTDRRGLGTNSRMGREREVSHMAICIVRISPTTVDKNRKPSKMLRLP